MSKDARNLGVMIGEPFSFFSRLGTYAAATSLVPRQGSPSIRVAGHVRQMQSGRVDLACARSKRVLVSVSFPDFRVLYSTVQYSSAAPQGKLHADPLVRHARESAQSVCGDSRYHTSPSVVTHHPVSIRPFPHISFSLHGPDHDKLLVIIFALLFAFALSLSLSITHLYHTAHCSSWPRRYRSCCHRILLSPSSKLKQQFLIPLTQTYLHHFWILRPACQIPTLRSHTHSAQARSPPSRFPRTLAWLLIWPFKTLLQPGTEELVLTQRKRLSLALLASTRTTALPQALPRFTTQSPATCLCPRPGGETTSLRLIPHLLRST